MQIWVGGKDAFKYIEKGYSKKLIYVGNFPDARAPRGGYMPHFEANIPSVSWSNLEMSLSERYFNYNLK